MGQFLQKILSKLVILRMEKNNDFQVIIGLTVLLPDLKDFPETGSKLMLELFALF